MARSDHASYTAAERYERRATRRQKMPTERRQGTRVGIIRAALQGA